MLRSMNLVFFKPAIKNGSCGKKKSEGNNHISLYLQIFETDKLPLGWEVHAKFSLFVFDQVRDRYLTIQDAGGKVRRFYNMKTEWGFDKLLPLSTFTNPLNGYLVDDTCAFGAEILVVSNATKRECLSIVKVPENKTYTWKINDFTSTRSVDVIFSDQFIIEGCNWKLMLYPNGSKCVRGKSLSLFLVLADANLAILASHARKLYTKYKLRIHDQLNNDHLEKQVEHFFGDFEFPGYGIDNFLPLELLDSAEEGFLVDNTLIVEVEILLLSKHSEF